MRSRESLRGDGRRRVSAGLDNMGGVSADRLTGLSGGVDGDGLGNTGGSQSHTLVEAEIPEHDHDFNDPGHDHDQQRRSGTSIVEGGSGTSPNFGNSTVKTSTDVTGITISPFGGDGDHNNVQPVIILNKIIRTGL